MSTNKSPAFTLRYVCFGVSHSMMASCELLCISSHLHLILKKIKYSFIPYYIFLISIFHAVSGLVCLIVSMFFFCFQDAQPTEAERETWKQVDVVLMDARAILDELQAYNGAGKEIREVHRGPTRLIHSLSHLLIFLLNLFFKKI